MNTKRLVLAASLVLFAAISGSAAARTVTTGERQWTNATDASAEIQSSLFEPGTASPRNLPGMICIATTVDQSQTIEATRKRLVCKGEVQ